MENTTKNTNSLLEGLKESELNTFSFDYQITSPLNANNPKHSQIRSFYMVYIPDSLNFYKLNTKKCRLARI